MIVYLDTSAVVKLYVEEEEGREIVCAAVEESDRIATSVVAYAETRAALARKRREMAFTDEQCRTAVSDFDRDWSDFFKVAASIPLARRAGEMAETYALRGFDAIHLASAKRLEARFDDLRFLAFDNRLMDAAKEASISAYESA